MENLYSMHQCTIGEKVAQGAAGHGRSRSIGPRGREAVQNGTGLDGQRIAGGMGERVQSGDDGGVGKWGLA